MISASAVERTAIDALEPGWRRRGYTVVREPSPDQLPDFLKGLRPDAIAIGATPSLMIEVLPSRTEAGERKIGRLESLFAGRDDWRLEVIYASSSGLPLSSVNRANIRSALNEAQVLAKREPRAGLLIAWATLEAIGRYLEPHLANRSLSSASLIDVLISNGHVEQSSGAELRRLGAMRNMIAHGQIDTSPRPDNVMYLVELGEKLVSEFKDKQ